MRRRLLVIAMTGAMTTGLATSSWAFGGGGVGGYGGFGVPNPIEYYPHCPRGRVTRACGCYRVADQQSGQLCRAGEYCDARDGNCH
jgi:hypothetical protein